MCTDKSSEDSDDDEAENNEVAESRDYVSVCDFSALDPCKWISLF